MKARKKRLRLVRETVGDLTVGNMEKVAAGERDNGGHTEGLGQTCGTDNQASTYPTC